MQAGPGGLLAIDCGKRHAEDRVVTLPWGVGREVMQGVGRREGGMGGMGGEWITDKDDVWGEEGKWRGQVGNDWKVR